jgi:hypothetical protein
VAFLLDIPMPELGVPALVAQVIYSTESMGSEADGGTWQGMNAIWLDFLNLHQGVVAPTIEVLTIDQNVAPIGFAIAALPSAVRDQPYTLTPDQLLQGFSDDDFDPLSISGLVANGGGQILPQLDGSWQFIPDLGFIGPVEISYTVNDGQGLAIDGQLMFVVKPPNNPGTGSVLIGDGVTPAAPVQGTPLTATHTLADADGLGTLSVSWSADGVAIAGATNASYTIASAATTDSGTYRAKATNSAGNAESNALTINVVVPVIAPKNVVASVVITTPSQGANSGSRSRSPKD